MAKDTVTMQIVNENVRNHDKQLDAEIEMIFGKPIPPNITDNAFDDVKENGNVKEHGKKFNGNNNVGEDTAHQRQPLLEPRLAEQLPPLAGPEIDDLDGDPPKDANPYPGIDDGLLESGGEKPSDPGQDNHEPDAHPTPDDGHHVFKTLDEGVGTDDVSGLGPRFGVDDRGMSPIPGVIPDVNTYQQKKNLAQGMMDLALLSANANQLRYVLESTNSHPYYYSSLTFISLSIIIQVLVGVGLILNSRYDVNNQKEICKADKINNMTVLGIFLITIVNVFITSFSVATPTIVVNSVDTAVIQSGMPLIARPTNFTSL